MISGIIIRSILLLGLSWLLSQRGKPLFSIGDKGFDLASLVMLVGGGQLLGGLFSNSRARLSEEEERMRQGPLSGLDRGDARRFLDQGMWMHGKAGDTLTREGDQVTHLYWLESGEAEVVANRSVVGRLRGGSLIGEATVLSPEPATATVRLTSDATFWCAPAKALSAFLAAQPHTRHALEHGFTLSLKDKLDAMNRLRG